MSRTTPSIESLTPEQRDCLRLVLQHQSSKQIAHRLGVSPHTIDQRIKLAMRKLGAGSRIEAAQMLAASECGPIQPLVYQSPDLVGMPPPVQFEPVGPIARSVAPRRIMIVPTAEQPVNELSPIQRLAVIAAVAIGSALAFGAVLAGLAALEELILG